MTSLASPLIEIINLQYHFKLILVGPIRYFRYFGYHVYRQRQYWVACCPPHLLLQILRFRLWKRKKSIGFENWTKNLYWVCIL